MDRNEIEQSVKNRDSFPVIDFLMSPEGRRDDDNLRTAIVSAIQAPNRPLLDTILDPRLELDLQSALDKCNALWLATEAGDIELMEALLVAGENAHAPGREGLAPLISAAAVCNLPAVRLLLEYAADVRERDEQGQNALHLAANTGPVHQHGPDTTELPLSPPADFARLLIEYKADIEARDEKGATPLMAAALRGNLEMLQALLEHKADVHATDQRGNTALHYAALATIKTLVEDKTEYPAFPAGSIIRLLVARGADVNHANAKGVTPLHSAAERGNLSAAEALLENGADVRAHDVFGMTPLIRAPMASRIVDDTGWRIMHPQDRSSDLVYVLIEHGADVEERDMDGNSALDMAAEFGRLDAIEALLACGADPNLANNSGRTPLQVVAEHGYGPARGYYWWDTNFSPVANALLKGGADLEFRLPGGRTALMCAAAMGRYYMTKALLAAGANVNARDNEGRTALFHVVFPSAPQLMARADFVPSQVQPEVIGWKEIRKDLARAEPYADYLGGGVRLGCLGLLIKAGADIVAVDNGGHCALTIAAGTARETGDRELYDYLADRRARYSDHPDPIRRPRHP